MLKRLMSRSLPRPAAAARASPQFTVQPMEFVAEHDEVEEEHEAEPVEQHPYADDVAEDIAGETMDKPFPRRPVNRGAVEFKPKGMYLGRRRDSDEPVDIKATVLASTPPCSAHRVRKTVMAKALIEEAAPEAFLPIVAHKPGPPRLGATHPPSKPRAVRRGCAS